MYEDEDQETSEFDIESRNMNKLEKDMKLIGFREGAIKGKDLSLQEGFNVGYSDGFILGERLGMIRGIANCLAELGPTKEEKPEFDAKVLEELPNKSCILCSVDSTQPAQLPSENFEDFVLSQQCHINKVINSLKNSDFKLYFENG